MSTERSLLRDPRLYIVFGITLMGVMGVSVIAPAFPRIARALDLTTREVGLLITVFTVPGIFIAPLFGFMADRIGRRKIVIPSLVLFGAAGSACATAPSFPVLLVLRTLQGFGAAALTSLSVTLLGDMYEAQRRDAAVGYNASVLSIGTAAYPAIGGALASIGWQYPFLLSAAALPIAVFALVRLRSPEPRGTEPIGARVRAVLENAWRRGIVLLSLLAVLVFILLYGVYLSYVPFLLEERFGLSSALVGLVMSSTSIATAITASRNKQLSERFSPRIRLGVAFLFYALGLSLFAVVPAAGFVLFATVTYGIGQGMTVPTLQGTIAARAPLELRGATMAVNAMAIRVGQTVGPLVSGVLYGLLGLGPVFAAGGALAVVMAAIGLVGLRGDSATRGRRGEG